MDIAQHNGKPKKQVFGSGTHSERHFTLQRHLAVANGSLRYLELDLCFDQRRGGCDVYCVSSSTHGRALARLPDSLLVTNSHGQGI